ncbi:condensation domain-containing protein [Nocardiopsis composta]
MLPEAPGESLTVTEVAGDTARHAARARERMRDLVPDPSSWPLVRLHLTRGPDRAHLHLSVDLLAADHASVRLLLDELSALYADPGHPLPPLQATFRDYVLAHRSLREGGRHQRDRAYWAERAGTLPPAPELPLVEHSPEASARFTRLSSVLPPDQWRALRDRAAARGLTPPPWPWPPTPRSWPCGRAAPTSPSTCRSPAGCRSTPTWSTWSATSPRSPCWPCTPKTEPPSPSAPAPGRAG